MIVDKSRHSPPLVTPPPLPHSLSCSPLFIAALNVLVGVSRAHHLVVHAVTYQGIANEWLDWLRGVVDPEEEAEEAAAAAEAGSKRVWVDGAISGAMRF